MRSVCGMPTSAARNAKNTKLTTQNAGKVTSMTASIAGMPNSCPLALKLPNMS